MTQSHTPAWAGVRGVSHIALDVADLDRSAAFYQEALGLDIFLDERRHPTWPNIKGLIGGFAIELQQIKAESPSDRVATPGTLCVTFTVQDIDSAFGRFLAAGYAKSEAVLQRHGIKMFFARDPDGYVFELIEFPAGIGALGELAPMLRATAAEAARAELPVAPCR